MRRVESNFDYIDILIVVAMGDIGEKRVDGEVL